MPNTSHIKVFDNLLKTADAAHLASLVKEAGFLYGAKGNLDDPYAMWTAHLNPNDVLPLIWAVQDKVTGKDWRVESLYANAYGFGEAPGVHQDHTEEGHSTALYYCHTKWHPDWGAETLFWNEPCSEIDKAVFPKPGRIVFFDSRILHCARPPTRQCPEVRYSIAIKLKAAEVIKDGR